MDAQKKTLVILMVTGFFVGWVGFGDHSSARIRIGHNAEIQADLATVDAIEETFNQAEEAIYRGDLDALMKLYSKDYHYKDFTKKDIRAIWKDFFQHYHNIATSHSFSKIVVRKGKPLTAEVLCTGSLWATSNETNRRVNLASWLGDIHFLVYEDHAWRIRGQDRKAPDLKSFGGAPPPLF